MRGPSCALAEAMSPDVERGFQCWWPGACRCARMFSTADRRADRVAGDVDGGLSARVGLITLRTVSRVPAVGEPEDRQAGRDTAWAR
jgi:hypothetical protein